MLKALPGTLPDVSSANKYHVYFQADQNTNMIYPAIVYERVGVDALHANDGLYKRDKQYQVTIIDRNPDSPIPDAVAYLRHARFVDHFKRDGLNHDIYTISF